MNTTTPLEIKVIFDATARRGPGRAAKPVVVRSRHERSYAWTVVAVLNLLVASAMYYAVWWRADPEIYLILMMKTPVEMDLDMAAGIFVPSARPPRGTSQPAASTGQSPGSQYSVRTTQRVIGVTAYGWLTLATVAACALGLSGGAAAVRGGGTRWRTFGWIAFGILLLGLMGAAYTVWRTYGREYPPNHLRMGMGGLVLLSIAAGLAIGRDARRLSRLAAIILIIAAAGTTIALYLGARAGAIEPQYAAPAALATVFASLSAYSWLLLLVTWRLSR